jgi:hypothetical protein
MDWHLDFQAQQAERQARAAKIEAGLHQLCESVNVCVSDILNQPQLSNLPRLPQTGQRVSNKNMIEIWHGSVSCKLLKAN